MATLGEVKMVGPEHSGTEGATSSVPQSKGKRSTVRTKRTKPPTRIGDPRIINLKGRKPQVVREDEGEVYCGRAINMGGWHLPHSKWHNPYKVAKGTPITDEAVEAIVTRYEAYVRSSPTLMASLPELVGKRLACWCAPNRCHTEVLLKLCDEIRPSPE